MTDSTKIPTDEPPDAQLWQRWRQGERVDVADFLAGFGGLESAERVAVLLVDQRERWQVGQRIPAEAYLRRFPDLEADSEAVVELAYGEFLLREQRGERPVLEEYQWRFPNHYARLRQQVELHRVLHGTGATTSTQPIDLVSSSAEDSGLPVVPGYEILGELGRGNMGVVYRAVQTHLNRVVAFKRILSGGDAGPKEKQRFLAEAEAIAAVKHPGIVQIFDLGIHNGLPFFSLEFCDGGSLAGKLAGKPLSARDAAQLVEQLAQAIQAAHEKGIVHRDLKPANILLSSGPASAVCALTGNLAGLGPKVTDFGLAKRLEAEVGMTATGAVMGTPAYMAPEQAQGKKEVGPAADIYSLGAILYECLTGRPPFQAATVYDTLLKVVSDEPAAPRAVNAKVSADLETICLKCLHKDPDKRYASATDLADDLRRFLEDRPIRARRVGVRERALKWRRRHPVAVAQLAAAVVLLLIGAGALAWYWDAYWRVKIQYYANFVKSRGVPIGAGYLSEAQARARGVSYRLTIRGGKVEQMEVVNGHGIAISNGPIATLLDRLQEPGSIKNLECRYSYRRGQQGELLEETAFDRTGNTIWMLHYTTPTTAHYTDPRGLPRARTGSGAAYLEFVWTEEGFEGEVRYLDRSGLPHPNDEGVYGHRKEHDARGLVRSFTYLDARGRPVLHKDGFSRWTASHDERGNQTEKAYLDSDGKPTLCKDGFARLSSTYDEHGNQIEQAYFNLDGKPTLHRDGNARFTSHYDEHGNEIEMAYFGLDGKPTLLKQGYSRLTCRYDDQGNRIEQAYFDLDGKPCLHRDGNASFTCRYDDRGNRTEHAYFGIDGKPTLLRNGYSRFTSRYDERGDLIEQAFFGIDGKPAVHVQLNAGFTATYDEHGHRIMQAYFGTDGKPALHGDGNAGFTSRYDERGNEIERAYFGVDGKPSLHKNGLSRFTCRYDEYGHCIKQEYFGLDGKPALHREGNAGFNSRFDEYGNEIEMNYFGLDATPTLHRDGYSRLTCRFDQQGHRIEQAYFGLDGKRARHVEGNAGFTARFDERGNLTEFAYFGVDGKLMLFKGGFTGWTARFDDRGNEIERAYFGPDKKPILLADSYTRSTARFDERGNRIEETYFDLDGNPALHRNGYARTTFHYDNRGNCIERAYLGLDGKPALHSQGNAIWVGRYDERNNLVEEAYSGFSGKPVIVTAGYARVVYQYDEHGNETRRAFFGRRGKPILLKDGYAGWTIRRDRFGNPTDLAYFGIDGQPATCAAGFARWVRHFDERGNMMEEAYFGADGKPVITRAGFARVTFLRDTRGNPVEATLYRLDVKPFSRVLFDDEGPIQRILFGPDGSPIATRVTVIQVLPDGAGAQAGLRRGDIVDRCDGKPVISAFLFMRQLRAKGGATRSLDILRGGKQMKIAVPSGALGIQVSDMPARSAR
jgi:hypothetical protein